jgi:predicted Zn-dependent protease
VRITRRNRRRDLAAAIAHGRSLVREQKDQEALEFLEKATRDFPESPEIPLLLATVYRDFRPDAIPALLAKAVELGSDDPVIQVIAGHRLLNEGDVDAARACAARAGDLIDDEFPLMADLDRLIGRIAARDGDDVVAETRLRSALRREPELPTHSLDLARFLWARGRDDDALVVIDESVSQVKERSRGNLEQLRSEIAAG